MLIHIDEIPTELPFPRAAPQFSQHVTRPAPVRLCLQLVNPRLGMTSQTWLSRGQELPPSLLAVLFLTPSKRLLLCFKGTLTARGQLGIHKDPQLFFLSGCFPIGLQPVVHRVIPHSCRTLHFPELTSWDFCWPDVLHPVKGPLAWQHNPLVHQPLLPAFVVHKLAEGVFCPVIN